MVSDQCDRCPSFGVLLLVIAPLTTFAVVNVKSYVAKTEQTSRDVQEIERRTTKTEEALIEMTDAIYSMQINSNKYQAFMARREKNISLAETLERQAREAEHKRSRLWIKRIP